MLKTVLKAIKWFWSFIQTIIQGIRNFFQTEAGQISCAIVFFLLGSLCFMLQQTSYRLVADFTHPKIFFLKSVVIDSTEVITKNVNTGVVHKSWKKGKRDVYEAKALYNKLSDKQKFDIVWKYQNLHGIKFPNVRHLFYWTILFYLLAIIKVRKSIGWQEDMDQLFSPSCILLLIANIMSAFSIFVLMAIRSGNANVKIVLAHNIKNLALLNAAKDAYMGEFGMIIWSTLGIFVTTFCIMLGLVYVSMLFQEFFRILGKFSKNLWNKIFGAYENAIFMKIWKERQGELINSYLSEKREVMSDALSQGIELNEFIEFDNKGLSIVKYKQQNVLKGPLSQIPTPKKEIVHRSTVANFFKIALGDQFQAFYKKFRANLKEEYQNVLQKDGADFTKNLLTTFLSKTNVAFEQIKNQLSEKLRDKRRMAQQVLDEHTENVVRRFITKITTKNQKNFDKIFGQLADSLIDEIKCQMDEDTVLAKLKKDEILPNHCKYYINSGSCKIVVIEQEPTKRNCMIGSKASGEISDRHFYLSFPYVIFVLVFKNNSLANLYVFFRQEPIKSLQDKLYQANFTNMYDEGNFCLGFHGHKKETFTERVDEVISYFWNSLFNGDISSTHNDYVKEDSRFKFTKWERETKTNPEFIMGIDLKYKFRLSAFLKERLSNKQDDSSMSSDTKRRLIQIIQSKKIEFVSAIARAVEGVQIENQYSEKDINVLMSYEESLIGELSMFMKDQISKAIEQEGIPSDFARIFSESCEASLNESLQIALKKISFYEPNMKKIIKQIKEL